MARPVLHREAISWAISWGRWEHDRRRAAPRRRCFDGRRARLRGSRGRDDSRVGRRLDGLGFDRPLGHRGQTSTIAPESHRRRGDAMADNRVCDGRDAGVLRLRGRARSERNPIVDGDHAVRREALWRLRSASSHGLNREPAGDRDDRADGDSDDDRRRRPSQGWSDDRARQAAIERSCRAPDRRVVLRRARTGLLAVDPRRFGGSRFGYARALTQRAELSSDVTRASRTIFGSVGEQRRDELTELCRYVSHDLVNA